MSNPLDSAPNPLDGGVRTISVPFRHTALIDAQSRARAASRQDTDLFLPQEQEYDPQYEPVIRLTEKDQVQVKTYEEDEDVRFKM